TITSVSLGQPTTLSSNLLSRQANSYVSFRGYGSDLGTASNTLMFFTPLSAQFVNGVLPFGTLSKVGDIDFVAYDPVKGVFAAPSLSSFTGATPKDNIKLTGNATISAATSVNAVLIASDGVTVGGSGQLTINSGLLVAAGGNDAVSAPLEFGGATALVVTPNLSSTTSSNATLDLSGVLDGQLGVTKFGTGRANFDGANTYLGVTNVLEGVLRITNGGALGAAGNNNANLGTVVVPGAALELDGSAADLTITGEALTLSGSGFGYGNTN